MNAREQAAARDQAARRRVAATVHRLELEADRYRARIARLERDRLTLKQREGLTLWADGRTLREVARELGISKTAARWRVTMGQANLGLEAGGTLRDRRLARAALAGVVLEAAA